MPNHAVNYFRNDPKTAYEALSEAQRIAFAPIVFQACRILRDSGVLELIQHSGSAGMTLDEVAASIDLPRYGIKVLLESGLGIGLFYFNDGRFVLTNLGHFMLHDPMTRINMDVVHEICYRGMFDLDRALREGKPAGLKTLGGWNTFYEGLAAVDGHYDFVAKMDVDLEFGPRYFERLVAEFAKDPKLAAASGKVYRPENGQLVLEFMIDEMVAGQFKFYRRDAFEQIGGFVRELMWDGIDFHRARMLGFRTASLEDPELRILHLRRMGSSDRSIYRGRMRWGAGQWFSSVL